MLERKAKIKKREMEKTAPGEHVDNMTEDLQDKLQEKARSFVAFSIAAQESTDGKDTPHIAVFIHGVNETFDVTEELLGVVPMTGTTSGNE
ncbi:General transcription factor II-I repeat domain-containing protein 2 [Camelus dromedarius]|uniref:General transcription factor II-I repeat domain-containing protein 2 n=1 Tax=Camelus dromedarius TaxID=9838 RepID=A0A5N4E676_CAMDR|nr:General transcription factor II-I repeat domain-containing protein 2 [Camelus dromedarius]KAB1278803.1 General transcription factor II-I repeat domain-containing protein 2 [Camelus dromedarius]